MSSEPEAVTVRLLDREFLVSCAADEREGLIAAAATVDARMRELRKSMANPGFDRLAVLVALSATHELLTEKQHTETSIQSSQAELGQLRRKVEAALAATGQNDTGSSKI